MIHYQKILELDDEGVSLRGIAASTGNSRQKVTVVIILSAVFMAFIALMAGMGEPPS